MFQLKRYAQSVFVDDQDGNNLNNNQSFRDNLKEEPEQKKLFPERYGFGWTVLRFILTTVFYLCHLVVAIIFVSFFVSAIAFSITAALDMVSEMIAPAAATESKKNLLSTCLFFLLFALFVVACLILSLFWEVLKVVLLKSSLQYNIARVLFLVVAVIVSGVWVGIEKTQFNRVSFAEYVQFVLLVSWVFAFVFSLLGSALLLMFVFTHSTKNRKILVVHILIVLILVAFAVICPIAFGIVANQPHPGTISFVFFFPLISALLVIYTYFRGKKNDRKTFIFNKSISLLFLALFIFTIILSVFINTPATCKDTCKDEARKNAEEIDRKPFSSNRYQVCSKTWTSAKLSIADLAFFANLTYNRAMDNGNSTAVQTIAKDFFNKQSYNWTMENNPMSSQLFHLRYKNTHVVGIKGPVTNTEFAETAKLWNEVAALQSIGIIVPFLNYFPIGFISEYVAKTSFINTIFHSGSNTYLFEEIERRLKQINKTANEVVLVGHSFGGGIAKIIGARLQIPAVSFSSPGITYGHVKFGFQLEDASRFVVSISPQNDFVPLIDSHAGLEQKINCNGKTFAQCHLIERTYCELHNGCGLGNGGCQSVMDN